MLNTKEVSSKTMGPTWEGPYQVVEALHPSTYQLAELDDKPLSYPWNVKYWRIYYQ